MTESWCDMLISIASDEKCTYDILCMSGELSGYHGELSIFHLSELLPVIGDIISVQDRI